MMHDEPRRTGTQRRTPRTHWLRRILLLSAVVGLAVSLSGCFLVEPVPIDVTVRNRCVGPNNTVRVFINNRDVGTVTSVRTFRDIRPGTVRIRAVGTGWGGSTYLHERIAFGNFTWEICGGGGTLSIDSDGDVTLDRDGLEDPSID